MENIPLWHERDISHSSNERIILPDSCLVLDYTFSIFTYVMTGLQVYPQHMKENLQITKGLIFSQRVLLALIEKGLTRQQAYQLVQRNAMKAWKERVDFLPLLKADNEVIAQLPPAELSPRLSIHLRHVDRVFRRGQEPSRAENAKLRS
jgi:adenylosuccinate lyase